VKSDILRVRDAPGNDGTVLFSLKNRDSIEVTEVQEDLVTLAGKKSRWVGVKHRDYEGWVFGAFLGTDSSSYIEGDDIDKQFIFPFNDPNIPITSNYGWRSLNGQKNYHKGIDLGARQGTPVLAAADGTVIHVKEDYSNCRTCGYGTYVIMQHSNGHRSLYGHLSQLGAAMGQKFSAGEVIGKVGNTGHSYGAHLHFEIIAYEEYVDPNTYLHAHLFMVHSLIDMIASF
jgi:murein DD-endopeptidase MepM/ murein hydrolase activator NlpD